MKYVIGQKYKAKDLPIGSSCYYAKSEHDPPDKRFWYRITAFKDKGERATHLNINYQCAAVEYQHPGSWDSSDIEMILAELPADYQEPKEWVYEPYKRFEFPD